MGVIGLAHVRELRITEMLLGTYRLQFLMKFPFRYKRVQGRGGQRAHVPREEDLWGICKLLLQQRSVTKQTGVEVTL